MSEAQRRLDARRKEIDAKNEAAHPSDPDNQDQGLHLNQQEWEALDRLDALDGPADGGPPKLPGESLRAWIARKRASADPIVKKREKLK